METIKTGTPQSHPPIPINPGSEILIELKELKLRLKSTLVGVENGQYLIARLSPRDLMGNFRSDSVRDSSMVVSYMHNGTVYGFQGEILNVVSSPEKLFFVSYPKKIQEMASRSASRVSCSLNAIAMIGNDIMDMVITDISCEGCQCLVKVAGRANKDAIYGDIVLNRLVSMKVKIPGTLSTLEINGRVRNESKDEDKISLGIKFEGLSAADSSRIKGYMLGISEEQKSFRS